MTNVSCHYGYDLNSILNSKSFELNFIKFKFTKNKAIYFSKLYSCCFKYKKFQNDGFCLQKHNFSHESI